MAWKKNNMKEIREKNPETLQKNEGVLNMSYCRMCVKEIIGFRVIWTALHTWLGADSYLAD